MTVILEELRRLEEAHRRGDVSTAEYDDLRSAVTSLVEEAEILDDRSNPSQETCIDAGLDTEMPEIPHVVQLGVLVCLAIVAIIGVLGWLLQDLTLALTLHQIGVPFRVFEATREIRPLGVGINAPLL